MNKAPLKAQHWLIFALVAVLFFAWGAWLMRSTEVEPVANLQQWRDVLLQPLAEDELTLMCRRQRRASYGWSRASTAHGLSIVRHSKVRRVSGRSKPS